MIRLLVVFATAAVVASSLAAVSQGTAPGRNGRIVFERLRYQNTLRGELFVINPDGSGARKVTHPPDGTEDRSPDWAPDGSRIAFERAPSVGAHSIWTVTADGSRLRRLSPPCPPGSGIPKCAADDGWPAWSPDGRHIVFQRFSGALRPKGSTVDDATAIYKDALVVTDANGRHARTLVWLGPWRGNPQDPVWSPDGKRLAFIGWNMTSRTNGAGCGCPGLYVVNADGSGMRRITPPTLPADGPDWSPDGSTIMFRTHIGDDSSGLGANLYTIHPDGTGLEQLTHFPTYDRVLDGSYSPDGTSIVFETSEGAVGGLPDVYVSNADGTDIRPLTRTKNFETQADWGSGPAQSER